MKPPFNYTTRHFIPHLVVFLLLCSVVSIYKFNFGFGASAVTISATVMLGAPENAAVTNTAPGSVNITWDESLSEDFGHVAKYEVYAKLKTDLAYPLAPILTVTDIDGVYSEAITSGISTTAGMDFIVYALTSTDFMSPASNTATNQTCGNTFKDPGEACDGVDFGGQLCTNFGYVGGTLSCNISCVLVFTSCSSGGGGGGGGSTDTTPPIPGTATAPAYTNTKPTTITYSGASDSGGSGLSFVELWYKKGTGSWMNSGLTSVGISGSFAFSGFTTDDTYYFDLVAQDGQGNRSDTPTSSGDTSTKYDTAVPIAGTSTVAATSSATPIVVSYSGAGDGSGSGLKTVELWYKKGSTGTWTSTGLTKTTASGSFDFITVTGDATYYFDLVAEDNAGNRSAAASGSGDANTVYNIIRPTALLSGTPSSPTYISTTNITVGGTGVTAYKYKLDGGSYGAETPVATKIMLSGLTAGTHTLYVIGKNSAGTWQLETSSTQFTWYINLTKPTAILSNLPEHPTSVKTTNILVGGTDVIAYKYKLDSGSYGAETLIANNIQLSGLSTGNHIIYVIAKNNAGNWQLESSATQYSWTVNKDSKPVAVLLTNLPLNPTYLTTASITVGGTDVIAYKYKLDSGLYGAETLIATNIHLSGLALGEHTIYAIGKNADGDWQKENAETSYTWVVSDPCGNGILNTGEACDDGNVLNGDGCSSICAVENLCGNNVINTGEECDDGNTTGGDGCSPICAAEVSHCANLVKDADETDIDCGGDDCALCHLAAPAHCSNQIKDDDETGTDCGGDECNACLTIDFTAIEKPESRTTHAGLGVSSNIELNNRSLGKVTNLKPVSFNDLGAADFDITDILPGNYDAGIKGAGYLRAIVYNMSLMDEATVRTLDFTFGNTYELIAGDVWSDNVINAGDVAQIIKTYATPNASVDMNRDGFVNAADMALVLRNYFKIGDSYF